MHHPVELQDLSARFPHSVPDDPENCGLTYAWGSADVEEGGVLGVEPDEFFYLRHLVLSAFYVFGDYLLMA